MLPLYSAKSYMWCLLFGNGKKMVQFIRLWREMLSRIFFLYVILGLIHVNWFETRSILLLLFLFYSCKLDLLSNFNLNRHPYNQKARLNEKKNTSNNSTKLIHSIVWAHYEFNWISYFQIYERGINSLNPIEAWVRLYNS